MPSDRTTVTELGTALGMLGHADVDTALASRSGVMLSVAPELWARLDQLRSGGAFDTEFHAAFENGRAFLAADDGLRGRLPRIIEWKGTGRAPGDEVAPIDLRVDHVYLISCKYLSNILFNVSPAHIFDDLLTGGSPRGGRVPRESNPDRPNGSPNGDWYAEVAPAEHQALYEEVRLALTRWDEASGLVASGPRATVPVATGLRRGADPLALPGLEDSGANRGERGSASQRSAPPSIVRTLPERAIDLTTDQRQALGDWLKAGWPGEAKAAYHALGACVSARSAERWQEAVERRGGPRESMIWRLLRMGSAPYFVLGSSATRSLRLRIATPWDWREHFALLTMTLHAQVGGQPRVGWLATVRDRSSNEVHDLSGHIEIRWSHGRFGGPPEAKGYLDTPHHLVPGYFTLR